MTSFKVNFQGGGGGGGGGVPTYVIGGGGGGIKLFSKGLKSNS